jgi:hypothetical protein
MWWRRCRAAWLQATRRLACCRRWVVQQSVDTQLYRHGLAMAMSLSLQQQLWCCAVLHAMTVDQFTRDTVLRSITSGLRSRRLRIPALHVRTVIPRCQTQLSVQCMRAFKGLYTAVPALHPAPPLCAVLLTATSSLPACRLRHEPRG